MTRRASFQAARAALAALVVACGPCPAQPASTDRAAPPTIHARLDTILDLASGGAGATKARTAVQALFDEQIVSAPLDQKDAWIAPARWARLLALVKPLKAEDEVRVLGMLRQHPQFASDLAFQWRADKDKTAGVLDVAQRLMTQREASVEKFHALAAAVCVVFDTPRTWEFGRAPDALDVFDYFVQNDARLVMSTRTTPPALVVYVADSLVAPSELEWALARYGTDRAIARRYAEVPYDKGHFPAGGPLKLASVPATLENILKVGGVCRHQAHYAAHAAKAQGIPSAIVRGVGSGVSHAWLGYLEVKGNAARWNFDAGRFGEYRDMTGSITDPQTQETLPDGRLALVALASGEPPEDRQFAAALVDAAVRLGEAKWAPPEGAKGRSPEVATRLALLEAAVRACPAHAPAWDAATALAEKGLLSREQLDHWSEAVVTLCATDFPDFAVDTLVPLIRAMKDPVAEDARWAWTYDQFSGAGKAGARGKGAKAAPLRADLAARICFERGAMWEGAGEPAKAWASYNEVIERFANQGPFVVEAALRCEKLLERESKPAQDAINLYAKAWGKVAKPAPGTSPEFLAASNYTRLGARYATLLDRAGRDADADRVRKALPIAPKPKPPQGG